MNNSKIEWTDRTDNPIRVKGGGFYCTKVSEGCKNCYAEVVNNRFFNDTHVDYKVMHEPPELELREDILAAWARMSKPKKIFVSSMTDVFGEFVPDEWIFKILDAMIAAPKQQFQLLTKRATRMRQVVYRYCTSRDIKALPANICCMVSVENQKRAVERIAELQQTLCSCRGLSVEPLLGPIRFDDILTNVYANKGSFNYEKTPYLADIVTALSEKNNEREIVVLKGEAVGCTSKSQLHSVLSFIDWVVVGGESGRNARPMHPEWVISLRDQCAKYAVPFFFKQWGEWYTEHITMTDHMPVFKMYRDYQHFTHKDWVNKNNICLDMDGKICHIGKDFQDARYPVVILTKTGRAFSGNELEGIYHKDFPEHFPVTTKEIPA